MTIDPHKLWGMLIPKQVIGCGWGWGATWGQGPLGGTPEAHPCEPSPGNMALLGPPPWGTCPVLSWGWHGWHVTPNVSPCLAIYWDALPVASGSNQAALAFLQPALVNDADHDDQGNWTLLEYSVTLSRQLSCLNADCNPHQICSPASPVQR